MIKPSTPVVKAIVARDRSREAAILREWSNSRFESGVSALDSQVAMSPSPYDCDLTLDGVDLDYQLINMDVILKVCKRHTKE